MGQDLGRPSSNKTINQKVQEVALGKQNVTAACPKEKLEFKFFSGPSSIQTYYYLGRQHIQFVMIYDAASGWHPLNCGIPHQSSQGLLLYY